MIIANKTSDLKKYLDEKYEKEISEISSYIDRKKEEKIASLIAEAKKEAKLIVDSARQLARNNYDERIAREKYEITRKKQLAEDAFAKRVIANLKEKIEKFPQKKKKVLIDNMVSDIKKTIREKGFDENDFKFKYFEGENPKFKDLKVVAESNEITFRDSVENSINAMKDEIMKETFAQIVREEKW